MIDQCGTFSEPNLSITIDKSCGDDRNESRVAKDVFCCVDIAIGIPKFTLGCLGCQPDDFDIGRRITTLAEHDNYFSGIHYGVVNLAITGIISCNVTDDLGTYVVMRTMADEGEYKHNITTDSPCGVCDRWWTPCLLYGGPILGSYLKWQLVCKWFLLLFMFIYISPKFMWVICYTSSIQHSI